jgi:hypothetical protein
VATWPPSAAALSAENPSEESGEASTASNSRTLLSSPSLAAR